MFAEKFTKKIVCNNCYSHLVNSMTQCVLNCDCMIILLFLSPPISLSLYLSLSVPLETNLVNRLRPILNNKWNMCRISFGFDMYCILPLASAAQLSEIQSNAIEIIILPIWTFNCSCMHIAHQTAISVPIAEASIFRATMYHIGTQWNRK